MLATLAVADPARPLLTYYDDASGERTEVSGVTDAATVDGTTYEEWGRGAQVIAESYDIRPGDRVLIDAGRFEHPIQWLLAPFAAGATVVLCANLDPAAVDARTRAERVTRAL